MGVNASRVRKNQLHDEKNSTKGLLMAERAKLLQKELKDIVCSRERESRAYERDMMVFACKEAEWKKERKRLREERKRLKEEGKRLREEVKQLTALSEEKEERIRELEVSSLLVEHMEEEKARRDEAVDKWKKLYLTIKTELDNLIASTYQGEMLSWRVEDEDLIDELQRELKAKEDTIELLQAQLVSAKQEESKKGREADILRQSLRIMSNKKTEKK